MMLRHAVPKITVLLLICLVVFSGNLYYGSTQARANGTNVLGDLIGSSVVASSTNYGGLAPYTFSEPQYSGQALTDGNTTATVPIVNLFSAWQQSDVKSGLLYDLGGRYSFSNIAVYADTASVFGVNVYIGDHMGDLASTSNLVTMLGANQLNGQIGITPRSGRYILFMFTSIASTNIAKVAELQAFGSVDSNTASIGPDNVALGKKPTVIKVTGTSGDLSQLTDLSVSESTKTALTDGHASTVPGSNVWQWDGKIWSGGTNGLTYVLGYNLNEHDAISRLTFSTPAGTSPANWSVYLSDDPTQLLGSPAVCSTSTGTNETFNYSCSLATPQTAQYVTLVIKAQANQDSIFPSEIEIYGGISAVWGVSDGKSYNTDVKPMFNNATATLSRDKGTPTTYSSGTSITDEGNYKLLVTANGTGSVSTVNFNIDKTVPSISGITNGATYTSAVIPTISDSSTVSGALTADTNLLTSYTKAFVSGTAIAASGSYRLTATDAAGNVKVVNFTLNNPSGGEAPLSFYRGVNLPTAGFAGWVLPGVEGSDFEWDKEADFQYFAEKGFNIIRVAPLWERLQPTLGGSLDTNYLNGLIRNVSWAKKYGAKVIIDLHNYGRYNGNIIGEPGSSVTNADFNDLWVKVSKVFKNDPGIYAYDLMNEPHDMGNADWKTTSQAALTAIRNNGDHHTIMIAGDHWESAGEWTTYNPVPWITDPDNNFIYEAHEYFDKDSSGVYEKSYDEELALNPNLAQIGAQRLKVFGDWCVQYGVKGYIGEYGVPKTDGRWLTVLDNFMTALDQYGMDGTYWAGGGRWGSYPLAIQPDGNYTVDAPQMSILVNHLSSASSNNPPTTPGSSVNVLGGLNANGVVAPSADYGNYGMYAYTDSQYSSQSLTDGDLSQTVAITNQFNGWSQPAIKSGELYDLGSRYDLSSIAVYADNTSVTGIDVYIGDHKGDLGTMVHKAVSLTVGELNTQVSITPKTGRYILFIFTGTANGTANVAELKAFGTLNPSVAAAGPDNIAQGVKPNFIKITGASGNLSQLTDTGVSDAVKIAMTDGRVTSVPNSKDWQWDGKVWTGTNGLTYVIGFDLGQTYNVSRFSFDTPSGTEPAKWSVYLSNDPNSLLGGSPAYSTAIGTSQTYNYSGTLNIPQSARYVTFVIQAQTNQDAIFPAEIEIFGQS